MNENSRIVKNSLVLYIRLLVVSIVGLLTSRFVLQGLGVSDYGLYSIVGGIVSMMAVVNFAMTSTTYRFIAFEIGKGEIDNIVKVFNISIVIHLAIALLVIILASTLGVFYIKNYLNVAASKVNDALFVFIFSILGVVISIISTPFQGLLTAKEKFMITAPVEILRSLIYLGMILIIMHYTGIRLRLYAILVVIVTSIPPVLYYIYCRYHFSSIIHWKLQNDKSKYKEMIGFSGWVIFGTATSVGETQGSALIINSFFGTILNASFGIAEQVNTIVKMFSQGLGQAVIPQITKSYSTGSRDRSLQLVSYMSKYSFFLMLLPTLPILLETDFILNLWLKEVPVFTKIFIQIMLINALITTMSSGIPSAVHATGKIKYFQIVLGSMLLISLPIAYVGFKLGFPPYTILLVYTFTAVVSFIIQNFMLKKIFNNNIEMYLTKTFLKMMLVLISVFPLFFIRDFFEPGFLRFISISPLAVIWLLIAIYYLGIERKEKEILSTYTLKIKKYIFNRSRI